MSSLASENKDVPPPQRKRAAEKPGIPSAISGENVRSPALRAVISLGIVIAAYGLYVLIIAAFLEPRRSKPVAMRSSASIGTPPATSAFLDSLRSFFADDAWELTSPNVLRSQHLILLFDQYQLSGKNAIHIRPCTLLVPSAARDESSARSPIIIQAPQGALLQFDQQVDLASADVGKPIGGRLIGNIRVFQPSLEAPGVLLELVTSNLQIQRQRLWTLDEVSFRYGKSYGRGRELLINLAQQSSEARGDRSEVLRLVRSVELVQPEQIHIDPLTLDRASGTGNPSAHDARGPVDVTCRGPVRIDLEEQIISCEENVDLVHHHPAGTTDSVRCHRLTLWFQWTRHGAAGQRATPDAARAAANPGHSQTASPAMTIVRAVAVGNPVVINAPSYATFLRGTYIEYDWVRGTFHLVGGKNDASNTDAPSRFGSLRYGVHQIETVELSYRAEADGSLGHLVAQGPGHYRQDPGSGDEPLELFWAGRLQLDRDGDRHRLSLDGSAGAEGTQVQLRAGSATSLDADHVAMWLVPDRSSAAVGGLAATPPAQDSANSSERKLPKLRPERLVAWSGVPLLSIDKDRTTAPRFTQSKAVPLSSIDKNLAPSTRLTQSNPVPHDASRRVRISSARFVGSTNRLDIQLSQPVVSGPAGERPVLDAIQPASPRPDTEVPPASDDQFEVVADDWEGTGTWTDRGLILRESRLAGRVRVKQIAADSADRESMRLEGETLHMLRPDQPDAVITVSGRPAQVTARGSQLLASHIQLMRGTNQLQVDGPGELNLQLWRDLDGSPLAQPQPARIVWQHGLTFDGLVFRFRGDVHVQSVYDQLSADDLQVQLDRSIDFAAADSSSLASVQIVRAHGRVHVEHDVIEDHTLDTRLRMVAPQLAVNRLTGEVRVDGAGSVRIARRGFAASAMSNSLSVKPASDQPDSPLAQQLTFLQIDFQQGMSGNLRGRDMKFFQRVRVVYGPIDDWDEVVDPEANRRLGPDEALMTCDELTVAEGLRTTRDQPTLELIALSNTMVEGRSFTARAQRISYDQAKDLLILEGAGRFDAQLWHQSRPGAPRTQTAARLIRYWPHTQRVEVDNARYLDLSNLGTSRPKD